MKIITIITVGFLTLVGANYTSENCLKLESAFRLVVEPGEEPACRCMPSVLGEDLNEEFIYIGCTRQNMPSVFRTLKAPNETYITQLRIWNSIINIIPKEMFSKVRPKILSIENSMVSMFRPGAFANVGSRLQSLFLKSNIVKNVDNQTFDGLKSLKVLDMSGNKLSIIPFGPFNKLQSLETLHLANNQILEIQDGAFSSLVRLRNLNLAHNKLTKITKQTFIGLDNLEQLNLEGNNIINVDWNAFKHMKHLRIFNLGGNQLTNVDVSNLSQLKHLILNNNKIRSLRNVDLHGLPNLEVLNLDKNNIIQLNSGDLESAKESSKLVSLSFIGNNMTYIDSFVFEHTPNLNVLSLQMNNLTSLSSVPNGHKEPISWLSSLKNLHSLFLTWNQITVLKSGELNSVPTLKVVAIDHNKLATIDKDALLGLQLKNLFLNRNELYYLPESLFKEWNTDNIYSVDLADNPWECICGHEWIGEWLKELGNRSTPSGNVGCLYLCGKGVEETPRHSTWITVAAGILAFVALLFLMTIAYLYMQETCNRPSILLNRIPSDMVRLIASTESLSFPNPFVSEMKNEVEKLGGMTTSKSGEQQFDNANLDKKRVRFNGV